MDLDIPYPMTQEEYELLCEVFGSLIIDEMLEEYEAAEDTQS